jgi:hypothetical protein
LKREIRHRSAIAVVIPPNTRKTSLHMVSSARPKSSNATGNNLLTPQQQLQGNGSTGNHRPITTMKPPTSSSGTLLATGNTNPTNSGWNSAAYNEALNVLCDDTMSQACALVLQVAAVVASNDTDVTAAATHSSATTTATTTTTDSSDHHQHVPKVASISNSTVTETTVEDSVPTMECSGGTTSTKEFVQLQLLYERCCRAVATYEREGASLFQQQRQQQQLQPTIPYSSTQSGIPTSASATPGIVARTKVVVGGVIHNSSISHRTSSMRGGPVRPHPGPTTVPVVTGSSKGSISAAINGIANSGSNCNNNPLRRQRLEREKSDSSTATTTSSSTTPVPSPYVKNARTTAEDTKYHKKNSATVKNLSETVPPLPPPSARQFLAMLNSDTSKAAKSNVPISASTDDTTEPKTTKRDVDAKSPVASPISSKRVKTTATESTVSATEVVAPKRSGRIQPPRASRK